ncbi:hypothetical protein FJU08_09695 [Martelella alba]|uniref:Uncharacterized protein n=1 Tax=Martelella alba TaxID=2590451 RepID=A0A506UE24_9HYPH|nr:hypothetical protein [Martelella alba]TPW30929.1 hypothetical protein FJU08_09695 [Martelella alba]
MQGLFRQMHWHGEKGSAEAGISIPTAQTRITGIGSGSAGGKSPRIAPVTQSDRVNGPASRQYGARRAGDMLRLDTINTWEDGRGGIAGAGRDCRAPGILLDARQRSGKNMRNLIAVTRNTLCGSEAYAITKDGATKMPVTCQIARTESHPLTSDGAKNGEIDCFDMV